MKIFFDHEKLGVYREAIAFCAWAGELLNAISAKAAPKDQLDVLVARRLAPSEQIDIAKENLGRIVQMLMRMLRRFLDRADFLREEGDEYGFEHEQGHEYERSEQ